MMTGGTPMTQETTLASKYLNEIVEAYLPSGERWHNYGKIAVVKYE